MESEEGVGVGGVRASQWGGEARFETLRELGRGEVGVVVLAVDHASGRRVALKRMHPTVMDSEPGRELWRRFQRDAEAVKMLIHDHIGRLYDVGDDAEGPFIAMEYVEGGSLDEYLRSRPGGVLPVAKAVAVARAVAEGLVCAHRAGVVHGNLKPSNIMVAGDGDKRVLKIVDFGLALGGVDGGADGASPAGGATIWRAPEQRLDVTRGDERADVFSWGKVLYAMVAGAECRTIQASRIPLPGLAEVILRSVQRVPGRRYENMQAVLAALAGASPQAEASRRPRGSSGCPSCGAECGSADRVCGCGAVLSRECPECGGENALRRVLCGRCGANVSASLALVAVWETVVAFREQGRWEALVEAAKKAPPVHRFRVGSTGRRRREAIAGMVAEAESRLGTSGELGQLLAAAEQRIEAGELAAAAEQLARARQLAPEDGTITARAEELEYLQLKARLESALPQMRRLLADARLGASVAAQAEVRSALDAYVLPAGASWEAELDGLRAKCREVDGVIVEQQQRVEREIGAARAAMATDLDAARDAAAEALRMDKESAEARELMEAAEAKLAVLTEQWEQCQQAFESGVWGAAAGLAEQVLAIHAGKEEAAVLRSRARRRIMRRRIMIGGAVLAAVLLAAGALLMIGPMVFGDLQRGAAVRERTQAVERALAERGGGMTAFYERAAGPLESLRAMVRDLPVDHPLRVREAELSARLERAVRAEAEQLEERAATADPAGLAGLAGYDGALGRLDGALAAADHESGLAAAMAVEGLLSGLVDGARAAAAAGRESWEQAVSAVDSQQSGDALRAAAAAHREAEQAAAAGRWRDAARGYRLAFGLLDRAGVAGDVGLDRAAWGALARAEAGLRVAAATSDPLRQVALCREALAELEAAAPEPGSATARDRAAARAGLESLMARAVASEVGRLAERAPEVARMVSEAKRLAGAGRSPERSVRGALSELEAAVGAGAVSPEAAELLSVTICGAMVRFAAERGDRARLRSWVDEAVVRSGLRTDALGERLGLPNLPERLLPMQAQELDWGTEDLALAEADAPWFRRYPARVTVPMPRLAGATAGAAMTFCLVPPAAGTREGAPLYLSRTPVTAAQLAGWRRGRSAAGDALGEASVSGAEARAFCEWLSGQAATHGGRFRLPTAAEWNRARDYGRASSGESNGSGRSPAAGTGGAPQGNGLGLLQMLEEVAELVGDGTRAVDGDGTTLAGPALQSSSADAPVRLRFRVCISVEVEVEVAE